MLKKDNREMMLCAEKLMNEIASMKFSFRKFAKVIELNAILSYFEK